MASTNQTTNYGLPIYSAGDRATWSDTNQPFAALDVAVKKAVDDSTDAQTSLSTISQTANEALSTATSASADASSALAGLPDKQDKTDNALNTTSKTVVGAINELDAGKQNASDNSLDTTSKTVVGAINEVNTAVGVNATAIAGKQDSTDNNLTTTAKTIVGAINEINGKASAITVPDYAEELASDIPIDTTGGNNHWSWTATKPCVVIGCLYSYNRGTAVNVNNVSVIPTFGLVSTAENMPINVPLNTGDSITIGGLASATKTFKVFALKAV